MNAIEVRSDVDVALVQSVGDDRSIIAAAKVSTAGVESLSELDSEASDGLIRYLMRNRHGTPFEHASLTFFVRAPIFVFREFHRHRIGWSYNEESARYKELDGVFYVPAFSRPGLMQKPGGRPGQYEYIDGTNAEHSAIVRDLRFVYETAHHRYSRMLRSGVAKEVARMCLPVATYSSMYATCNPRSLMAFLSLRTRREAVDRDHDGVILNGGKWAMFPSKPQREIEMVAERLEESFAEVFPIVLQAFNDFGRVAP